MAEGKANPSLLKSGKERQLPRSEKQIMLRENSYSESLLKAVTAKSSHLHRLVPFQATSQRQYVGQPANVAFDTGSFMDRLRIGSLDVA